MTYDPDNPPSAEERLLEFARLVKKMRQQYGAVPSDPDLYRYYRDAVDAALREILGEEK